MNIKTAISSEKVFPKCYKNYNVKLWIDNIIEFKKKSENINIKDVSCDKRLDLRLDELNHIILNGYIADENNIPAKGNLISIYNINNSVKSIICDTVTDLMGMFQVIIPSNIDINSIKIKVSDGQNL